MFVSRETKEHTFHVKLQRSALLCDSAAPARRFEYEVVQVARRDTRHASGLRERSRTHAIELLPRFGRERAQLEVGKVSGQNKRRELRESRGCLALARQISVVLDL